VNLFDKKKNTASCSLRLFCSMYRAVHRSQQPEQRKTSAGKKIDRTFVLCAFVRAFGVALQMASHRERAVVKVTADTSRSLSSPSV
jgi:hypothetical protein